MQGLLFPGIAFFFNFLSSSFLITGPLIQHLAILGPYACEFESLKLVGNSTHVLEE